MKTTRFTLVSAGLALASASFAFQYKYDDGGSENSLGLTAGGNIAAAHFFTVQGGNNVLQSIDTTWGSEAFPGSSGLTGGVTQFRWFVWNSSAGNNFNSGNLTLVSQGTGTVAAGSIDTAVFQSTATGNVNVASDFFIGIAVSHGAGTFPLWLDTTSASALSWVAGSTTGNFDPLNVQGGIGAFTNASVGFAGAWGLRANAVPEPASMVALGAGALALLRRRRSK